MREFEAWTDLTAILFHGNAASRDIIRSVEWFYEKEDGTADTNGPLRWNVMVTTYETIITERQFLAKIPFQVRPEML